MVEGRSLRKRLGYMRVNLSLLMILATSSVLSTGLQISKAVGSTSEESISTRNENPKGSKRRVTSESDWKRYYGSSAELKQDVKEYGRDNFRREIISLHNTKGWVNYEETRQTLP